MNKLKRLMMLLMVFALTTVINPLSISANNIDISTSQTNIVKRGYFEARNSKGYTIVNRDGYREKIILANGVEAFCIEPEILLTNGDGYTVNSFKHSEREMFSRIIYHSYDNTNKTDKDWVVTQHVLWEYIATIRDDLTISGNWWFEGFDYNAEKTKIMNKVNAHNQSASFHNTTHNITSNNSLTLTDTNGVLANSTIIDNDGLDVSISNNQLIVTVECQHFNGQNSYLLNSCA